LLAFIAFQTFRRQDLLIDTLLQSVQNTTNSAVSEQRVKHFRERHEKRQQLSVCLQSPQKEVLPAFTDIERILAGQNFNDREKLRLIEKTLAATLAERQQVEKQIKQLQYETGDERDERDYYDVLQGKSLKLQQRASAIVRQLQVDENNINPALFDALRHFQSKGGSIEKNAPQGFLTVKEKSFLPELLVWAAKSGCLTSHTFPNKSPTANWKIQSTGISRWRICKRQTPVSSIFSIAWICRTFTGVSKVVCTLRATDKNLRFRLIHSMLITRSNMRGQNKGVSVYSFIDERHLLFYSTVISAAEREAAYVIDGLLHNARH
jgi:DNA-binding transcriptional MerR regulator